MNETIVRKILFEKVTVFWNRQFEIRLNILGTTCTSSSFCKTVDDSFNNGLHILHHYTIPETHKITKKHIYSRCLRVADLVF